MSLISEALRRAHHEALRQDRTQARIYRTPGVVDYPFRESRRRLMLALLATNVALAGVIGFMMWPRAEAGAAVPATRPPASAAAPPAPPPPAAAVVETHAPTEAPVVAKVESAPKPRPAPPPASIVRNDPSPSVAAGDRDGLADGRTYFGNVSSTRGDELVLYGITIAGDRGAALLNGKVVWPGETIGPYQVKAITRERVEIRYRDITFYLRLP